MTMMSEVGEKRFPPLPCKGCKHLHYGRRDERGETMSEIACHWWLKTPMPVIGGIPGAAGLGYLSAPRVTTLQGRIDGPFTDDPMPECPRRNE